MPKRRDAERGAALIAALWASLLAASIGGAAALLARGEALRVEAIERRARVEAIAEGATRLVAARLFEDHPRVLAALDADEPLVFRALGADIRALVTRESAKPDLNASEPAELAEAFRAAGVADAKAEALADAVADFRDGDAEVRLAGAEADDYAAAGLAHRPRDGAFHDLSELALVLGADAALARRAAEVVTVHVAVVEPIALGAGPETSAFERFAAVTPPADPAAAGAYATRGDVFRLAVTARLADGAEARVEAVVAPGLAADEPFELLEWSRP